MGHFGFRSSPFQKLCTNENNSIIRTIANQNININICSGEINEMYNKIRNENEIRWTWIKYELECIHSAYKCWVNYCQLIHRHIKCKRNKIDVYEMRMNDSDMRMRWNNTAWSIPEISVWKKAQVNTSYTVEKKGCELSAERNCLFTAILMTNAWGQDRLENAITDCGVAQKIEHHDVKLLKTV